MNKRTIFKSINPNNPDEMDEFLNFSLVLYGKNAKTRNGIGRTRRIIGVATDHLFFLAKKDGETVGRMAVGWNKDIVDPDGAPYGQIGLFEVIEDYQVFSAMVDFGKDLCKDRNHYILFPFFISTWYQYRFLARGFDSFEFFLETDNKDYYAQFATRYGVDQTYLYKSFLNDIDDFIEKNKKSYEKTVASGISWRRINKSDIRNELRIVYDLSMRCFEKNLFYVDISFPRFLDLYLPSIKILDEECFLFVLNEAKKPVGYIFCAPDYTDLYNSTDLDSLTGKMKFFLGRKHANGLIIKSGGHLPEYRGNGLSNASCYQVGLLAKKRNYKHMIVALTYSLNPSSHLAFQDKTEKDYELYKIAISV